MKLLTPSVQFLVSFYSGGSRISGKGDHMYKGVGLRFADFLSFFLNIPRNRNDLTETKLFHFHRMFKNWGGRGGFQQTP